MPDFDAAALDWTTQYKLMVGSVTPRPIALVTTIGPHGANAAPFSFFNAVGSGPPMLAFSAGPREPGEKDTVANIRSVPEFVVHIVSDAIKDGMNVCAIDYPSGVNELVEAGFTAVPSSKVRPPRIAESPIAMECKLVQIVDLGQRPNHLIIGEVVHFHYHEGLINERFHVDVGQVNPIGRLAGRGGYTRITDRFEMPRLAVPSAGKAEG